MTISNKNVLFSLQTILISPLKKMLATLRSTSKFVNFVCFRAKKKEAKQQKWAEFRGNEKPVEKHEWHKIPSNCYLPKQANSMSVRFATHLNFVTLFQFRKFINFCVRLFFFCSFIQLSSKSLRIFFRFSAVRFLSLPLVRWLATWKIQLNRIASNKFILNKTDLCNALNG